MDIGFSCVDGGRKCTGMFRPYGCEPPQIPTFDNVADFCGVAERSGMDYVAESKQDFAESLRFSRSFEVLSPLPLNERPKALSTDA